MKNLDMTMEDFLVKVSEMYQYNLEQYRIAYEHSI